MKSFIKHHWGKLFLGLTALVVGLEIFGSVDGVEETMPWTLYVVEYVPQELSWFMIGGLALWLYKHFEKKYKERREEDDDA